MILNPKNLNEKWDVTPLDLIGIPQEHPTRRG